MPPPSRRLPIAPFVRGLRRMLDMESARRRRGMIEHDIGWAARRDGGVIVPDKTAGADDVAIAERLLAAHRAAAAAAPAPALSAAGREDIWTTISAQQGQFASVLDRGDAGELAGYLVNVSRHDAAVGITQGDREYERLRSDPAYRRFVARLVRDKLYSLAEAVGAAPVENPEQGAFGRRVRRDDGELVRRISARLGIDVAPPDIDGGLLKIAAGNGLFGERDANAIYTANLLRQTTRDVEAPRICEIGGGSGRVAYWSRRLGLRSYTIVDLPHVNVVQGYYALKTLGAGDVALFGEQPVAAVAGRLQILPAHAIAQLREPLFDLVLNQDSFPEMSAETVTDYLAWITASCRGSMLSINQESKPPYGKGLAHISVPELTATAGGFELTYRFPYWLRRGYVVELYRIAR